MNSMRDNPIDGATLKCQRAAESQEVLDHFRRLKSSMSQQAMKAHAYAQTSSNP